MPPKNIRVTAEIWGAGPGMGGTAYVEFKLNNEVYDVFAGGTSLDGREKLGEVKLSDGWRGRVSFIVDESPPYHEEKSPGDIVVRGAKSPEAQLLAAAWSGEAGAQFVGLVLDLDDGKIENLIEHTQDDLACAIDTVEHARFELGCDDADVVREIRNMVDHDCVDWDTLRSSLDAKAASDSAKLQLELETARRIRESAISPHRSEIERILKSWAADEERNARAAGRGLVAAFEAALENYVVREGRIPSGFFEFEFWYKNSTFGRHLKRVIEVDLDVINPDKVRTDL